MRFTLEIDAGLTDDVLIDAMRLRQIVLSLLGNAIKFTDKGDVIFRAQQEWQDRKNLMLKLEVEDTGSGIDDATRQWLFRPFAQGINSQVNQGSGLGLFICHTLTKMMNGDITVNSEQGKGTRVTVLLKLLLIASSLTMPILQREQSAPSLTLNILIVDDNPAGRLLLAQQLTRLNRQRVEWLSVTVICREWTVIRWHIAFVRPSQILCCLALRQTHDHPPEMKLKNPEWTTVCLSRFHWQCWRSY